MSNFQLNINLNNDAFQPEPEEEIARILNGLIPKILERGLSQKFILHDINGNRVGIARKI